MEPSSLPERLRQDLMLYALDALDADERDAIETRVQAGELAVNDTLTDIQNLVSLIGYAAPPFSPPSELKAKLLSRIRRETQLESSRPITVPLADYDTLTWESSELPGISFFWLRRDQETGTTVALLKAAPGATFVAHRHRGAEDTLVLQGRCQDQFGQYQAGDFISYPPESLHTGLEALGEEGCILLIVSHQGFDVVR